MIKIKIIEAIKHMINSPKPQYIKNGVIIAICFIIYGVVGSILIMHLNLVDSLYYFVITMATVGYGDIVPKTLIQRIFAVTLALGGFGLIAYIFGVLLENFQYNMSVYSKGEKMYKKIKNVIKSTQYERLTHFVKIFCKFTK